MTKPKAPHRTLTRAPGCGVVLKSSVTGSSALAWRTTHLTWFPVKHAQPAETHSPGATWRRSVPFWGYLDLALAYFTSSLVDHFGKPGWHAARPRPAIGMERAATCRGAEELSPCPTRLHISAGYPSGFLSCFQSNHPKLKLPRLFESSVSPAPTWAGLGRARSIHPHTLSRSRSSAGRRVCTTIQATKQPSKACCRDNNAQLHSRNPAFWQMPSRTVSNANRTS